MWYCIECKSKKELLNTLNDRKLLPNQVTIIPDDLSFGYYLFYYQEDEM